LALSLPKDARAGISLIRTIFNRLRGQWLKPAAPAPLAPRPAEPVISAEEKRIIHFLNYIVRGLNQNILPGCGWQKFQDGYALVSPQGEISEDIYKRLESVFQNLRHHNDDRTYFPAFTNSSPAREQGQYQPQLNHVSLNFLTHYSLDLKHAVDDQFPPAASSPDAPCR
jgi:hypothetical protein